MSCAIVIYLSYCYGDQLSFAAFACLLRDPRHHSFLLGARVMDIGHCHLFCQYSEIEICIFHAFDKATKT